MDWFKIGKGVHQGCILSPCFFNLYTEYIMQNAGLDESQDGIKISGRNINSLRYADDTTLMAESEEKFKSLLIKVKEKSEKAGLKLSSQKTKIMASGPITSWQINGNNVGTVSDFTFLGSKINVDSDWSPKIKRCLLLGKRAVSNLDSVLKSRDITLLTMVHIVKPMVFSSSHVWMWELDHKEGWELDNWCFWMWCWRRLLRVPWTARRSSQSILKEINPEYTLEGLMMKLKLQYFGHLLWRADSWEKTLMLAKTEGKRRTEDEMVGWHHWFNGHEFEETRCTEEAGMLQSMWLQKIGQDLVTEQQLQ